MFKLKTATAAVGALALTTAFNANALTGIQIDPTGTGTIAGAQTVFEVNSTLGNVLFDNCVSFAGATSRATANECTLYVQSKVITSNLAAFNFAESNVEMHWAMRIPIAAWLPTTGLEANTFQFETLSVGEFHLFLDLDGDSAIFEDALAGAADTSGTGFSNLNGDSTTSIEILTGDVVLADQDNPVGNFAMTGTQLGTLGADGANGLERDDFLEANRRILRSTGSYSALIDVTSQDGNWVVNNLVDTGFTLEGIAADVTSLASSLLLPSDDRNMVGMIGGVAPNYSAGGGPLASGTQNDWDCEVLGTANGFGQDVAGQCDYQTYTLSKFTFRGESVPEPGTLALAGLTLTAFGWSRRRRAAK